MKDSAASVPVGFQPRRLPPFAPGMRIGLFGGSFDPPHDGHLLASEIAIHRLRLDRVWWLVSPGNPLKTKPPAPMSERVAAAKRLARDPRIAVTDIEGVLGSPYSYETIRYLQRRMKGVKLVWIVGADIFATFHLWREWQRMTLALPIAVIDRPGSTLTAASSQVALLLAHHRVPERHAAALLDRPPPAWVFLHGQRSSASSTAIRHRAKMPGKAS